MRHEIRVIDILFSLFNYKASVCMIVINLFLYIQRSNIQWHVGILTGYYLAWELPSKTRY